MSKMPTLSDPGLSAAQAFLDVLARCMAREHCNRHQVTAVSPPWSSARPVSTRIALRALLTTTTKANVPLRNKTKRGKIAPGLKGDLTR